MNRLYTTVLAATALTFTAAAQQLPNAGFEETWVDCVPWNSAGTTTQQGTKPDPWCPSNVVTPGMSAGNKTIATQITGNNSSKAIEVKNNAATSSQIIPAYFTLGTTWATAKIKIMTPSDEDGGTWGGLQFTYRPDAIQFDYKHSNAEGSTQPATVVVYSWKGSSSQTNVPAANSYAFINDPKDPAKVTMLNRDKNILGMTDYAKGDAPTYSTDFKLISKKIEKISDKPDAWTSKTIDIDYENAEKPEMFNVIFSAADYFADRSNHKGDDALSIDNVKLLYYSRLKSLSVNGTAVAGFDPDTYEYTVDAAMPADISAITTECLGNSGSSKADVALDAVNNKVTVTVTNSNAETAVRASSDATDVDGQTSHVYTLTFKAAEAPAEVVETSTFTGNLEVKMGEDEPSTMENTPVILKKMSNDTYTLLLEKFGSSGADGDEGLGDIEFDNVKLEGNKLSGTKSRIELIGGITAVDNTLEGTLEGNALNVNLNIYWDNEGTKFPILVNFAGTRSTSAIGGIESDVIDENAPVEYYNIQGVKVSGDNLAPGFYIVRQGKKVSKIFVK